MKTSYGLDFEALAAEEIGRFEGYDKVVAKCHIANCGKIIIDSFGLPIDNEYDLGEIYGLINE